MASSTKSPTKREALYEFATEALFLQAIAGLLIRMPNIESVQQLQGTQEFGKDLVFWTKGPLAERIPCACVLKRGRITGHAGRSSGARTVLIQAEQALDTPYSDGSGQEVWVQRVYVLTPGNISAEASNSIKGALRNKSGQIVFMGGHELFSLFRRYWPDYYSTEATILARYLERMRSELHHQAPVERLSGLYDLGNVDGFAKSVYVPLTLERGLRRYASRIDSLLLQDGEAKKLEGDKTGRPRKRSTFPKSRRGELYDLKKGLRLRALQLQRLLAHLVGRGSLPKSASIIAAAAKYSASISGRWERSRVISERDEVRRLLRKEMPALFRYENTILPQLLEGEGSISKSSAVLASDIHLEAMRIDQVLFEHFGPMATPVLSFSLNDGEWRRSRSSILIAGQPGSGKTSFCKWNALQDVEQFATGGSTLLPIYLPLQALADAVPHDMADLIGTAAPFSAFLGDVQDQLENGSFSRVRLYCDGLDEVPSRERRQSLLKILRGEAARDLRLQVVVTTRDYVVGNELDWVPRFYLGGLERSQIEDLSAQWFAEESAGAKEFLRQLSADPSLGELMRVPLLATLTILVFRRTGRLPENRGRLYTMFVELLSGGWDLAKGVLRRSRFGRDVKLIVLSRLAENTHRSRRRTFAVKDIKSAAVESSMRPGGSTQWVMEAFADELIQDGLLAPAGDGHEFQFRHLSFQEYLAARELLSYPDSARISSVLDEFLRGEGWWKEVLDFYILLSGNPRELWTWLDVRARKAGTLPKQAEQLRGALAKAYPNFNVAAFKA